MAFIWILLLSFIFILFVYILGGLPSTTTLGNGSDLNNFYKDGATYLVANAGVAATLINKPTELNSSALMFVRQSYPELSVNQIILAGGKFYLRSGNSSSGVWGNWMTLSYDVPTFYKNYSNINDLYSVINGMFGVGELNDVNANDITKNCIGSVSIGDQALTMNYPLGYGFIIHLDSKGYFGKVQIFISNDAKQIWTRRSTTTWSSWSRII